MSFDYIKIKESRNIIPIELDGKQQYYLDLMNIENSWTGLIDVMFSNNFFREAVQLVINAITLFEKGYFDCAFYSLRQSLELSTTVVYFVDDTEPNRKKKMKAWKNQDKFPMYGQMTTELQNREKVFADIKKKMALYFREIEDAKQKLNKYVHKQGYDKFYVSRNNLLNPNSKMGHDKLVSDFNLFLVKCMGAIAVFRLAIDPLPLLLADESIYNRTRQMITEGYSEDFMEKYIGLDHVEAYKQTDVYKSYYEELMKEEEMIPSVRDVVKNEYVDRTKVDEILSQMHLLSIHDRVAVAFISYSEKIARVYCIGGLKWYFTDTNSRRKKTGFSSTVFNVFKSGNRDYNVNYDEAFLSHMSVLEDDYYIEHNEEFSEKEIEGLKGIANAKFIGFDPNDLDSILSQSNDNGEELGASIE